MLTPSRNNESLAGKLLLSSALVAVSLAYGWWQRDVPPAPVVAVAPMPVPPAPKVSTATPDVPVSSPPASVPAAAPAMPTVDAGSEAK
ncbi:MAG TPA: hypothetical protein VMU31_03965, partial [Rhizomicrobium sp.]|nr:hypothetical protein [Rhizomicrobium sp.]